MKKVITTPQFQRCDDFLVFMVYENDLFLCISTFYNCQSLNAFIFGTSGTKIKALQKRNAALQGAALQPAHFF
ncbi:MAG: hypothetical protein IJY12_00015 [Clostridia bacterium]|nr:hypothetical protein [Clostridia bacterium]